VGYSTCQTPLAPLDKPKPSRKREGVGCYKNSFSYPIATYWLGNAYILFINAAHQYIIFIMRASPVFTGVWQTIVCIYFSGGVGEGAACQSCYLT